MFNKYILGIVAIYLFFPVASSSSVSLASFQPLPATVSVPAACKAAYIGELSSCTTEDFANGAVCSTSCQAAVTQKADQLITLCPGVVVAANSVLGIVISGHLLATLCPNKAIPTNNPQSTTAIVKTSAKPTPTPTPTSISTEVATTKSSKSSTLSTSPRAPSSEPAGASSSTSITSQVPASSSTQSTSTSSTAPPPPQDLTVQQQQYRAQQISGGGSPFDIGVVKRPQSAANSLTGSISAASASLLVLLWAHVILGG